MVGLHRGGKKNTGEVECMEDNHWSCMTRNVKDSLREVVCSNVKAANVAWHGNN